TGCLKPGALKQTPGVQSRHPVSGFPPVYSHTSSFRPRSAMSARLLAILVAAFAIVTGGLRPPLASAQEPTAEQVNDLLAKFRAERDEMKKRHFPADAFAAGEKSAAKAEAALKAGERKAAARLARDARWQLPTV